MADNFKPLNGHILVKLLQDTPAERIYEVLVMADDVHSVDLHDTVLLDETIPRPKISVGQGEQAQLLDLIHHRSILGITGNTITSSTNSE